VEWPLPPFRHHDVRLYDIAAGAAPLHEHQHEQEEVWHIVEGEEQVLGAGCIAVVPPDTPHSVRPLGACRAVTAD